MVKTGGLRQCSLGSQLSVEQNVEWKKFTCCKYNGIGFDCKGCKRYTCTSCLKGLFAEVKNQVSVMENCNEYLNGYRRFLQDDMQIPEVCHCCWIKKEEPGWKSAHKERCEEQLKVDLSHAGLLLLSDYGIGFSTPLQEYNALDCHGLGAEKVFEVDAAKHFVLGVECAEMLAKEGVYPLVMPEPGHCERNIKRKLLTNVEVPSPLNQNEKISLTVDLVVVEVLSNPVIKCDIGCNSITAKEFEGTYVFGVNDQPEEADVTVVVGVSNFTTARSSLLLLARWYNIWKETPLSNTGVENLYKDISSLTDQGNVVRRRTGGSSGVASNLSKAYLDLIKYPGNCPKKGIGQVFIVKEREVHVWYKAQNGRFTHARYSIPQYGGQWPCPMWMMMKYPLLFDFAEYKGKTAFLLLWLYHLGFFHIPICPLAVEAELFNIKQCVDIAAAMEQQDSEQLLGWTWQRPFLSWTKSYKNGRLEKKLVKMKSLPFEKKVWALYAGFNRHTLVQHAVGSHVDGFGKKDVWWGKEDVHSLENKICFSVPGGLYQKFGVGRGGGPKGHFTFAVLDWQTQRPGRRRVVMANLLPPNELPRRITEAIWAAFRINHPVAARAVDDEFE